MNKKDQGWVNVDEEKNKNKGERSTFEVDGEKYTPYAVSQTYRFPLWLKACFAKWWFPGMVYFFIFFGTSGGIGNQDILVLILGLACGLVTDIFLNHCFRDFSSPNHDYTKYILCGRKKSFLTLPINLAIFVVLSFLSAFCIDVVIFGLEKIGIVKSPDEFLFAVGALFYATFMLLFDLLFVLIRNLIEKFIASRKAAKVVETQTEVQETETKNTEE